MKFVLFLSCFLFLAGMSMAEKKRDVPYIRLQPKDALNIQVIDNLHIDGTREAARFHQIEEVIREVLEEVDFPMPVTIERFPSRRLPPNQARLDITIMHWGGNGFNELEVRFSASIKKNYDRNRLGIFRARGGLPLGGYMLREQAYEQVMQDAIYEMVGELNKRLATEILREGELEQDDETGLSGAD